MSDLNSRIKEALTAWWKPKLEKMRENLIGLQIYPAKKQQIYLKISLLFVNHHSYIGRL